MAKSSAMDKVESLKKQLAEAQAAAGDEAGAKASEFVAELKSLAESFPDAVRKSLSAFVAGLGMGGGKRAARGSGKASPEDVDTVKKALTKEGQTMGQLAKATGLDPKNIRSALASIQPKSSGEKRAKKYHL